MYPNHAKTKTMMMDARIKPRMMASRTLLMGLTDDLRLVIKRRENHSRRKCLTDAVDFAVNFIGYADSIAVSAAD